MALMLGDNDMLNNNNIQQAHQYKIRLEKSQEYNKTFFPDMPINIDLKTTVVKEISYKTAEKIILEYEWLKCMPSIVLFCYGIYFNGYLGGTVVYSQEYAENLGKWDTYGYTDKIILLSRGACLYWTPKGTASKLIMKSIKLLPTQYRVITATVDSLAGEIGTIYQACGFYYVGVMRQRKGLPLSRLGVKIGGKLYGSRSIRALIGNQKRDNILSHFPHAEFIEQQSKARYFYFRGDKREREQLLTPIKHLILPYPKRDISL
jgi:hypothetical protein